MQQRKEENGSGVAKNRSDIRSADDEVHEHQTRLVAYKSSLDKKRLDLEARNSGEDPQEVLGQKCSELQETVSALEHDSGQAKQLRKSLRGLRDQIEKAQMALDTHDEQEVCTLSCIHCGCEVQTGHNVIITVIHDLHILHRLDVRVLMYIESTICCCRLK